MIDFLAETRQAMIDNFQISLRAIRSLMGYSASDIADFVGVTRQTINNLETGKAKMSSMQYISIAAVVDNYILNNGEMFKVIETIINGNGMKRGQDYDSSFYNLSLLKRWFACFNDSSDFNVTSLSIDTTEEYNLLLQRLAIRYKVFVDTDVFLTPKFDEFFNQLADFLLPENAKIIIPMRAIEQIQEMIQDSSVSEKAVRALKQINALQRRNVIQIRGENSDSNIHDTVLSVFAKFRSLHRLCLLTQNSLFANEVLHFNESSEKQGFDIIVGYVDENGKLGLYTKQSKEVSEILIKNSIVKDCVDVTSSDELSEDGSTGVTFESPLVLTGWGQL